MRTNQITVGAYYRGRDGVTFRVESTGRGEDTTVVYSVAAIDPKSRSTHRVGAIDNMSLARFAAKVERRLTRRCKTCKCTDAHACPGGCSWAAWDLCSACVHVPSLPVCV